MRTPTKDFIESAFIPSALFVMFGNIHLRWTVHKICYTSVKTSMVYSLLVFENWPLLNSNPVVTRGRRVCRSAFWEITVRSLNDVRCNSIQFNSIQINSIHLSSIQKHVFLLYLLTLIEYRLGIHAFVTSRVDHCNGLLFGSHSYLLDMLQSVLNSAARLVLNIPKFSKISAAIHDELHWLPIRRRIDFKIALMVCHCLVGAAPEYLMELCYPVGSAVGRQCLRSASRDDLVVPRFRLRPFGHRAFAVSGPQIWNSLPPRIRPSRDNVWFFKQKLKSH